MNTCVALATDEAAVASNLRDLAERIGLGPGVLLQMAREAEQDARLISVDHMTGGAAETLRLVLERLWATERWRRSGGLVTATALRRHDPWNT